MRKTLYFNSTTAALVLTSYLEKHAPGRYSFAVLPMEPQKLAAIWAKRDSVFCLSIPSIGDFRVLEHVAQAAPPSFAGWPKLIIGGTALECVNLEDLLTSCSKISYIVHGRGQEALLKILEESPEERIITGGAGNVPGETLLPLLFPWHPQRPVPVCRGQDICLWGRCRFCHHVNPADCDQVPMEVFCKKIVHYYRECGWRNFYIYDNHMTPQDLIFLVEYMIAEKIQPVFDVFGMRLIKSALKLGDPLSRAPGMVRSIGWGLEIYSQRVLNFYRKGILLQNVVPILDTVAKAGVRSSLYLLIGLPGAEEEDYRSTYEFCRENVSPNGLATEAIVNWFLLNPGIIDRLNCPGIRLQPGDFFRVNQYFGNAHELSGVRTCFLDFESWDFSKEQWIGREDLFHKFGDVFRAYLSLPGVRYDHHAFYMMPQVWKRFWGGAYSAWQQQHIAPIPPPGFAMQPMSA